MNQAIRTPLLTVAVVCAVLGVAAGARAQSAVDGFDPGANGTIHALAAQPDGKMLVGGEFTMLGGGGTGTTPRNYVGRLNADGSVDAGFNPGANGTVWSLTLQPDGKILVGGAFTGLGGVTGTTTRNHIGRLNADGSLDTLFDPGTSGTVGTVYAMAVQLDGKIVVGGVFTGLGGGTGATPRLSLGRLNADGTVDTFNPGVKRNGQSLEQIYAIAVQPDGKIVVAGFFIGLGGGTGATPRRNIGRLNPDGSVDTFDPGVDYFVLAMTLQPDGKIVLGGQFSMLGGGGTGTTPRNYIGRLNADGSLDTLFDPGANSAVHALALQTDGKILVGGRFTGLGGGTGTTLRSKIGRLSAGGSVDLTFNPGANGDVNEGVFALGIQPDGKILAGGNFTMLGGGGTGATTRNRIGRLYADGSLDADLSPGANDLVSAMAVQPDGKILVGGAFIGLGGGTGTTARAHLGRLYPDGSLDPGFYPTAQGAVRTLAVQADGKILVGGDFISMADDINGSWTRNHIGRLDANGLLDLAFDPGADGVVSALALQPDGKILVGGTFATLSGTGENNLGRLNPDGSADTSFALWTNGPVLAIAVQPDGRVLVGGAFTTLYDDNLGLLVTRNRIARLNGDGSIDLGFDPGANGVVYALALQADGKILVGGELTGLGGVIGTTARSYIGRLNADGSLDSFDPGAQFFVFALAVQSDAKILVGGYFTRLGGGGTGTTTRVGVGRLSADGSLDLSFDPGANNGVRALAVQADGKILAGGEFTMLGGGGTGTATRNRIGRITNTDAAVQRLRVTGGGSGATWSRSGAGPEVWWVAFESSTDGTTYTPLGIGTRAAGGWQLGGQSVPTNQNIYVRARGYYGTGQYDGSGSIVESVRNVYLSPYQPFTDNVLTPGASLVRAVHITELRARIDAQRIRYGLSAFGWTDTSLLAGMTATAPHVAELRTALQAVYTQAALPALVFTDSSLVPGTTVIKAVHIRELRDAVVFLEGN